ERRRAAAGKGTAAASPALPARPYKFLNYFEATDEAIFFGRTSETRKLASKIHAYPLNLLYAASGSGKTSLIHAAVVPLLQRDGYLTAYARVYDDLQGEIRRSALAAARVSLEPEATLPLAQFLTQLANRAGRPLVVFVDQFEELFIRYDREV